MKVVFKHGLLTVTNQRVHTFHYVEIQSLSLDKKKVVSCNNVHETLH